MNLELIRFLTSLFLSEMSFSIKNILLYSLILNKVNELYLLFIFTHRTFELTHEHVFQSRSDHFVKVNIFFISKVVFKN